MNNNKLTVALALFLGLSLCQMSLAQTGDTSAKPKPTESQSPHLTRREILKRLNLTDDQNKLLQKHRASYRRAMAELDGQLKVKQVELENELEKTEPDQDRLDVITTKIGELYGQRLSVKVNAKLDVEKKILNAQQVDMLHSLQGSSTTDENL